MNCDGDGMIALHADFSHDGQVDKSKRCDQNSVASGAAQSRGILPPFAPKAWISKGLLASRTLSNTKSNSALDKCGAMLPTVGE